MEYEYNNTLLNIFVPVSQNIIMLEKVYKDEITGLRVYPILKKNFHLDKFSSKITVYLYINYIPNDLHGRSYFYNIFMSM